MLIWAGGQALALILAAQGWLPAAAQPGERFAVHVWVISQWLLLGLFFPYLFVTAGTAAAMGLLIWPYGLMASLLAGSGRGVTAVCIYQSVWVAALALGAWQCQTNRQLRLAAEGLRIWVFGGLLLAYLATDQSPAAGRAVWFSHLDPLLATLPLLREGRRAFAWKLAGLPLIFPIYVWAATTLHAYFLRRRPLTVSPSKK